MRSVEMLAFDMNRLGGNPVAIPACTAYMCICLVVCTVMACVKLKNEEQLELPHLEGFKSEAVLFVVIDNLLCERVS